MIGLSPAEGARLIGLLESWDEGLQRQARELLIPLLPPGAEKALNNWLRGTKSTWAHRCRAYLALRLLLIDAADPETLHLLTDRFGPKERARLGEMALSWARTGGPDVQELLPLVMATIAADYRHAPHQDWPTLSRQLRDIIRRVSDPLGGQPLLQQLRLQTARAS